MHIYFSFKKINKNEIKKLGDGGGGGAIDWGGYCPGGYCPGAIVQGAIVRGAIFQGAIVRGAIVLDQQDTG